MYWSGLAMRTEYNENGLFNVETNVPVQDAMLCTKSPSTYVKNSAMFNCRVPVSLLYKIPQKNDENKK